MQWPAAWTSTYARQEQALDAARVNSACRAVSRRAGTLVAAELRQQMAVAAGSLWWFHEADPARMPACRRCLPTQHIHVTPLFHCLCRRPMARTVPRSRGCGCEPSWLANQASMETENYRFAAKACARNACCIFGTLLSACALLTALTAFSCVPGVVPCGAFVCSGYSPLGLLPPSIPLLAPHLINLVSASILLGVLHRSSSTALIWSVCCARAAAFCSWAAAAADVLVSAVSSKARC